MKYVRVVLLELWLPIAVVVALWVLTAGSTSFYFPSLEVILRTFQELWLFDRFMSDVVPSVRNFLAGIVIAAVLGVASGVLLGMVRKLHEASLPVLEFMRAVPGIVLVPIGLVLLGVGDEMKIAIIAYGTVWPILLGTVDGIRAIDPVVIDTARSCRVPRWHTLTKVILPAASPQILAGARISVALGVVLIIASEYVASTRGIGHIQLQAERTFAIPEVWAALLLLGILGYASNVAFRGLERYLLRWYLGLRKTGQGATK